MGLDMYLYRAEKANSYKEASFTIPEKDFLDNEDMYCSLKPYLQKEIVRMDVIDWDRLKKDYDIPSHYSLRFGHKSFTYTYKDSLGNEIDKTFYEDDLKEKGYIHEEDIPYYFCNIFEVAYWRKDYELQETIYDSIEETIENCGFYEIDSLFAARLMYDCYDTTEKFNPDFTYFYHEWY